MTRLLPPAYFFAAIVLMLALHFLVPGASLISFPWRLIGILPVAAGIALNVDADRQFKALKTTVKPFQEFDALATDRSFRLSRNPMYLGMIPHRLRHRRLHGVCEPMDRRCRSGGGARPCLHCA